MAPMGLALFGLVVLAWRRRRIRRSTLRRAALVGGAAASLLVNGGCDVDPFCEDCVEDGEVDLGQPDLGQDLGRIDLGARDFGVDLGDQDLGPDPCAAPETCNGTDDDCDGNTDEGNPDGGALCGTNTGACEAGRQTCVSGSLQCVGATGPATEVCDGVDNDCDGTVDDGNPGGGGSCGTSTGACSAGTLRCAGGALSCMGATGPALEVCDTVDNDCDGTTDEGFSLSTSITNCGTCGRTCAVANGTPVCSSGACAVGGCDPGFIDADGNYANGCEFACSFSGAEVCNGVDDDCDMRTDEGLTAPSNFCNPNGNCAGTGATCGGASGWVCNYPSGADIPEQCDGEDDDCDGRVDETFTGLGGSCTRGSQGVCRTTGTVVCDGTGATRCNAPTPPTPATGESCNNLDDDCDGRTDESIPLANIPTATLPSGTRIMRYEASRPDATNPGSVHAAPHSSSKRPPHMLVTPSLPAISSCTVNSRARGAFSPRYSRISAVFFCSCRMSSSFGSSLATQRSSGRDPAVSHGMHSTTSAPLQPPTSSLTSTRPTSSRLKRPRSRTRWPSVKASSVFWLSGWISSTSRSERMRTW